jgi:hypothetical protein
MQGLGQFVSQELLDTARFQALLAAQAQQHGSQSGLGPRGLGGMGSFGGPGVPPVSSGGLSMTELQLLSQLQAAGLTGGPAGGLGAGLFGAAGQQFGMAQDAAPLPPGTAQGNAGQLKLPIGLEELSKLGRGGVAGSSGAGGMGGGPSGQQGQAGGKPTRSSDSRSSSAYASRHQAAEQRRRTRINER